MATRMQQRRGTAAQWTAANPTLAAGEIGFETDTSKFKMGNGSSAWTALTYFANAAELAAIVDGAPDLLNTLNELAASIGDDPTFLTTMNTALTATGTALAAHETDQTNIHGIANTAVLTTATLLAEAITAHNNDSTAVHGIADTSLLALASDVSTEATNRNTAIGTHNSDTTDVHGIANTGLLATQANITTHGTVTTNIHGIADTALLALTSDLTGHSDDTTNIHGIGNTADLATKTYADSAVSTHNSDSTDVHGIVNTSLLALITDVTDHSADTTNIHGIADTSALSTKTYADGAVSTAVAALTKTSVGLANVDNTSDANKPVSTAAQTALDLKAPLASPTFTGTVSGVTKTMVGLGSADDTADTAKPVSTAQASAIALAKSEAIADATSQVNALLTGAPAALNTLDELAAALGDDANFASTVTTSLGLKAPLASPTFTGTVTVAAAGVAFTDGTQTKAGVPSITAFGSSFAATGTLAAGEQDKFVPVAGTVVITLPASGYSTGQSIDFYQASGTGASFAATNSVVGTPGLKFRTTNSVVTAMKTAAGWLVFGDLSA